MKTIIIIFLVGAIVLYFYIKHHYKIPKTGSMVCVTGAVKSGKSTFSLALAYKQYKRALRSVKFRNWFRRKLKIEYQEELPLFYTTIPVAVPHVLLTKELLLREERFAYKSVIWVDEASLLADSQFCKDKDINDNLLMFNKLIAHETRGGKIIYNTQSIGDLHYSIKRCLSEVYYVHETYRWLPFLLVCTVREERYAEDNTVTTTYNDDLEDSLKRVVISKKVWKLFDCYAYSVLTDNLPKNTNAVEATTLKANKVISFNPRHCVEVEEKENDNEKTDS